MNIDYIAADLARVAQELKARGRAAKAGHDAVMHAVDVLIRRAETAPPDAALALLEAAKEINGVPFPPAAVASAPVDPNDPQELEDFLADAIDDTMDMDWTGRVGAKGVIRALNDEGLMIVRKP
jgi:hypothetical protein